MAATGQPQQATDTPANQVDASASTAGQLISSALPASSPLPRSPTPLNPPPEVGNAIERLLASAPIREHYEDNQEELVEHTFALYMAAAFTHGQSPEETIERTMLLVRQYNEENPPDPTLPNLPRSPSKSRLPAQELFLQRVGRALEPPMQPFMGQSIRRHSPALGFGNGFSMDLLQEFDEAREPSSPSITADAPPRTSHCGYRD
jgi:hypothetical protein